MSVLDEIEEYRRRILWAHYNAFRCIRHAPTKGAMRERVVSQLIRDEFPVLSLVSGVTCAEGSDWESPQLDIIELETNARQGINGVYRISDVRSICEVKTKAQSDDFRKSEDVARLVKGHEEACVEARMFAFATEASAEHVISQFGFVRDRGIQGFAGYLRENDKYPSIDCFVSMDSSSETPSPFLIVKDFQSSRVLIRSNARVVDRFLALYRPD